MVGQERALVAVLGVLGLLAAARGTWPWPSPRHLECPTAQVRRVEGALSCAGPGPLTQGERRVLGLPLELNLASAEELDALPGIGTLLAARIVADRQAHGPFGSVAALQRVAGIGPAKLRLLAPRVTVQCAR